MISVVKDLCLEYFIVMAVSTLGNFYFGHTFSKQGLIALYDVNSFLFTFNQDITMLPSYSVKNGLMIVGFRDTLVTEKMCFLSILTACCRSLDCVA